MWNYVAEVLRGAFLSYTENENWQSSLQFTSHLCHRRATPSQLLYGVNILQRRFPNFVHGIFSVGVISSRHSYSSVDETHCWNSGNRSCGMHSTTEFTAVPQVAAAYGLETCFTRLL